MLSPITALSSFECVCVCVFLDRIDVLVFRSSPYGKLSKTPVLPRPYIFRACPVHFSEELKKMKEAFFKMFSLLSLSLPMFEKWRFQVSP